jgi:CubicO group peptidase (beta-lactamase class C family)
LIGGDSWENLVKKHLFDPLDMTSSTFVTTANPKDIAIAAGYIEYYGELHSVPFEFSRPRCTNAHYATLNTVLICIYLSKIINRSKINNMRRAIKTLLLRMLHQHD